MLVDALAQAFAMTEDDMHKGVCELLYESHTDVARVVDTWLLDAGVSRKQYLSHVVNCGSAVDGLFVWLAANLMKQHINIIHATRIWTTRASEIVIMTNAALVFIMDCFLVVWKMHLESVKGSDSDSEYIKPFVAVHETEGYFVKVPQVLNNPVKDCCEKASDAGLELIGPSKPIQDLLADQLSCSVKDYHDTLISWIYKNCGEVHMVEKWLAIRGLDLESYVQHLAEGGTSDSLELWAASRAMNHPITVVMESNVFSMALEGPDFAQLTFILDSYSTTFLCIQEELEDGCPCSWPSHYWAKESWSSSGAGSQDYIIDKLRH